MFAGMVATQDDRLARIHKFIIESDCPTLMEGADSGTYTALYFSFLGLQEYLSIASSQLGFNVEDVKRLDAAFEKQGARMLERMEKCTDDLKKGKKQK